MKDKNIGYKQPIALYIYFVLFLVLKKIYI